MVEDTCIHPWDYAVEPFRIAGGLYYVGNKYVSSHLIDTGDGLILLDTSFPQTVYLLLESIRRLGFYPADIHTILHCATGTMTISVAPGRLSNSPAQRLPWGKLMHSS